MALPTIPRRIHGGAVAVGARFCSPPAPPFSDTTRRDLSNAPRRSKRRKWATICTRCPSFLGGSTVFEETLRQSGRASNEAIDHIYTVPKPLRLKKADALIFYISTDDKP